MLLLGTLTAYWWLPRRSDHMIAIASWLSLSRTIYRKADSTYNPNVKMSLRICWECGAEARWNTAVLGIFSIFAPETYASRGPIGETVDVGV